MFFQYFIIKATISNRLPTRFSFKRISAMGYIFSFATLAGIAIEIVPSFSRDPIFSEAIQRAFNFFLLNILSVGFE